MVVGLQLYLFDRTYCEEDWRSLSKAMECVMPNDPWTQADTDIKNHVYQVAPDSTIRQNLGPQMFQKQRVPSQNSRHQKGK
jgi:hypothetical protein